MCGIAGLIYADANRPVDRSTLVRMGSAIAHRGPDAEGYWIENGVGLVHRRLSIIDLTGGDQPIANEDGNVQVVFNGEIYNYRELRRQLEQRGHRFRTDTDTEVLVHLYEDHCEDLVRHLRGMFAFAIWDKRRRQLLLARDRVGVKPLYVYRDNEKLLFGSEIKAILAHADVDATLDPESIESYLAYGFICGRRSIFCRVEKLLPGHTLTVRHDDLGATAKQYWQLRFQPDESLSVADWSAAVRDKMAESVKLHMTADVAVGAFLSGGLDSSIVVALATDGARNPLQTFSVGFRENRFNELPYAREVAEQYGTVHTERIVTADAAELLETIAYYYDEPFADASAIPTFLVSKIASEQVKVVLSGDGGDEAFGGYSRYAHDMRESAVRNCLPLWLRRSLLAAAARLWPRTDWMPRPLRAKNFLTNLSLDAAAAYANTLALCRLPLRRQLLSRDVLHLNGLQTDCRQQALSGRPTSVAADGLDVWMRRHFQLADAGDPLSGMIATDVASMLPDDYLVKVDRTSMAHGLEVRPPLLDHELLQLCARIPSSLKIRNGETKWLMKQAFADAIPTSLQSRPKQGFEIPLDDWFRGPLQTLYRSTVLSTDAAMAEFIDQACARTVIERHVSGRANLGPVLWTLLSLEHWARVHLSGSCQSVAYRPGSQADRNVVSVLDTQVAQCRKQNVAVGRYADHSLAALEDGE